MVTNMGGGVNQRSRQAWTTDYSNTTSRLFQRQRSKNAGCFSFRLFVPLKRVFCCSEYVLGLCIQRNGRLWSTSLNTELHICTETKQNRPLRNSNNKDVRDAKKRKWLVFPVELVTSVVNEGINEHQRQPTVGSGIMESSIRHTRWRRVKHTRRTKRIQWNVSHGIVVPAEFESVSASWFLSIAPFVELRREFFLVWTLGEPF